MTTQYEQLGPQSSFNKSANFRFSLNYNNERDRLETFNDSSYQHKQLAAKTGLYYTTNKLKCHFCHSTIKIDKIDSPLVNYHLRQNSSCPLLRRQPTHNVPINEAELDQCLPPMFNDECGYGHEYVEYAYPEMSKRCQRRKTFKHWPYQEIQDSEDLVEAGFFYLGNGDKVYCFCCGIGLNEWTKDDIPMEEHAKFTNKCSFLVKEKSEEFVELVKLKESLKKNCVTSTEK